MCVCFKVHIFYFSIEQRHFYPTCFQVKGCTLHLAAPKSLSPDDGGHTLVSPTQQHTKAFLWRTDEKYPSSHPEWLTISRERQDSKQSSNCDGSKQRLAATAQRQHPGTTTKQSLKVGFTVITTQAACRLSRRRRWIMACWATWTQFHGRFRRPESHPGVTEWETPAARTLSSLARQQVLFFFFFVISLFLRIFIKVGVTSLRPVQVTQAQFVLSHLFFFSMISDWLIDNAFFHCTL